MNSLQQEANELNKRIHIYRDNTGRILICPDCGATLQFSWKEFMGYFLKFIKHNV